MEKENKKLKIIIAILVVVLLVLGAYHYFVTYVDKSDDNEDNSINDNVVQQVEYSDYVEEGNNYIYKYIFTKNNSYKSNIDIDDTYAIAIRPDLGKNIYILHDGKLYYNLDKCSSNDENERICNFTNYNLTKNSSTDDLKLFDEIVNIKRIKSVNFGSGVDYSVLIITEEGKIYLWAEFRCQKAGDCY